jgi:hypothetical protein
VTQKTSGAFVRTELTGAALRLGRCKEACMNDLLDLVVSAHGGIERWTMI